MEALDEEEEKIWRASEEIWRASEPPPRRFTRSREKAQTSLGFFAAPPGRPQASQKPAPGPPARKNGLDKKQQRRWGPKSPGKRQRRLKRCHRSVMARLNRESEVGGWEAWIAVREREEQEARELAEKQEVFDRTVGAFIQEAKQACSPQLRRSSTFHVDTNLLLNPFSRVKFKFQELEPVVPGEQERAGGAARGDSGTVSEFLNWELRALARRHKISLPEVEQLKRRFDALDKDRTGDLDHEEFTTFLKQTQVDLQEKFGLSDVGLVERVRVLFKVGENELGRITLDEVLKHYHSLRGPLLL